MRTFLEKENLVAACLGGISFLVYLTTLCPAVSFTDSGELATVATTLAVAHPTGYPLFTLLGRIAVMIPTAAGEILRLNLFVAFLTAAAVALFFKAGLTMVHSTTLFRFSGRRPDRIGEVLSACAGAMVVAFSSTFWSQSTGVEVYALHLVLLLATTIAFIRGLDDQLVHPGETSRYLLLFGFVLGLSFSNHMTTVLLAPAFLFLYFRAFGLTRQAWLRIVTLAPLFVLGLTMYFYLPIRSAAHPPLDWGHPSSVERFIWHVTGKQYRVWMFSGSEVMKKQLMYFLNDFPLEFHWVIFPLLLLGLVQSFRRSRRLFMFFVINVVTTLLYASNYDIHDIDSYFLLSYIVCGWFVVLGTEYVIATVQRKGFRVGLTIYAVLIAVLAIQLASNRKEVDESTNFMVQDFTANIFGSVEPKSVIFSGLWDYFISPSYYEQVVQNARPDLVVVDNSLLQNRSWYFTQLARNHPWLVERTRGKVDAFLEELSKFEHDEPFNFNVINSRWNDLINNMVQESLVDHAVYVDGRIEPEFSPRFKRIPAGLLTRLTEPNDSVKFSMPNLVFRNWAKNNAVTNDLRQYGAMMLAQQAMWLKGRGRIQEARVSLQTALSYDPHNRTLGVLLQQLASPPN